MESYERCFFGIEKNVKRGVCGGFPDGMASMRISPQWHEFHPEVGFQWISFVSPMDFTGFHWISLRFWLDQEISQRISHGFPMALFEPSAGASPGPKSRPSKPWRCPRTAKHRCGACGACGSAAASRCTRASCASDAGRWFFMLL